MRVSIDHLEAGHVAQLEIATDAGGTYRIEVTECFAVRKGETDYAVIEVWHGDERIYSESAGS